MGDVFLPGVTDLFGDPVPRSRGKKGRPAHVPTAENRQFVQLALVCGQSEEAIAEALGITDRTLQRHYFHELGGKRAARLRLEMKNMAAIVDQVNGGKVAAMSLLDKKLEKLRLRELDQHVRDRRPSSAAPTPSPAPIGKKAQAKQAAGQVQGKYAPPPAPRLVN